MHETPLENVRASANTHHAELQCAALPSHNLCVIGRKNRSRIRQADPQQHAQPANGESELSAPRRQGGAGRLRPRTRFRNSE